MGKKKIRGTLSVEAAMTLPFFLIYMVYGIMLIQFAGRQEQAMLALTKNLRNAALIEAVTLGSELGEENQTITLHEVQMLFGKPFPKQATARAFTGMPFPEEEAVQEDAVFVTEYGTVYHETLTCSHIRLSVRLVPGVEIPLLRNTSGGRYYPCEYCTGGGDPVGNVYITDYGDRWHLRERCTGLKRSVQVMTRQEAEGKGYRPCKSCGGTEE